MPGDSDATAGHTSWLPCNTSCSRLWDSKAARFSDACIAQVGAVPSVVAVCLLLGYCLSLSPLLKRPLWCRRFAAEEGSARTGKRWTHWTAGLALLSGVGLTLALVAAVLPAWNLVELLAISPWAASTLIIAITRPRSTPKWLLTLFIAMLACQLVRLLSTSQPTNRASALAIAQACTTSAVIVVILCMPLRDPNLDRAGISRPFTSPTYHLRSPEDNLTLWQFMTVSWMAPLIARGYKQQLHDEDVWLLPYEFQHSRLHVLFRDLKGSVVKRLLTANGLDLTITSFLGIVESAANLSAPVLLQQLLRSIEDGDAPKRPAVTYAAVILAVRLIACQSAVFSLWYCRRCYERSRGEMITMIYEKTLTRKSFGFREGENKKQDQNGDANGTDELADDLKPGEGCFAMLKVRLRRVLRRRKDTKKPAAKEQTQPASMGKILNLMRNDVYEVAQRFWEFPAIITKPLNFLISIILIWRLLGWPCLLGTVTVIIAQLLNGLLVSMLLRYERIRRAASDVRLQATSQFVEAIRHLRWYDWQDRWLAKIMDARQRELSLRIITGLWHIAISTTNMLASALFPVVSFWAYTVIAGRELRVDVAFPALQLFNMLATSLRELPALITVLLNASVAVGRIEAFMAEPDKEDLHPNAHPRSGTGNFTTTSEEEISFQNASFAWPGASPSDNVLQNITFTLPRGGLTLITGKVGAGKTALLQAILGELDHRGGEVAMPDQMVGYCAQSPWLQNMTIRDNIVFSSSTPFDEARYKQTLDVCALVPDLASFKHGDLSDIGENGIGLSGGQKARVALARAVYSRARVLLLDDPLAALDHNTAETIVDRLLRGPLVEERTVVLVTHRVDLCAALAEKVIEVFDGTARIVDADALDVDIYSSTSSQDQSKRHSTDTEIQEQQAETQAQDQQAAAAVPEKFIAEEYRAEGGVVASVYWEYIKAGKLKYWALLIAIFAIFRLNRLLSYWFLKAWGEAYEGPQERSIFSLSGNSDVRPTYANSLVLVSEQQQTVLVNNLQNDSVRTADLVNLSGLFSNLPSPSSSVMSWILVYFLLSIAQVFLYLLSEGFLLAIIYTAGQYLYHRVLRRVSEATFRFYDTTPVGRLMNRLTSDIGTLDGGIGDKLQSVAWYLIAWVSSVVVIAGVTPIFLAFSLALTLIFFLIFFRFLPTSQSLRRLEMVSLSPLMSNFGALLDGLTTVRAFRAQPHFQNRVVVVTDAFQKMDHFYWSLQAWLMYRFDALSACSTFAMTLLALYDDLSPGLTAFMLTTASNFVLATHSLCKQYGQLQMDFVSVERVVELLHLEQEPVGSIDPPAAWPAYGEDIVFENVSVKYAENLEPSLEEVNVRIPGGKTTAVVGRTGSGKSTLALTLLATVLPQPGGQIHVGDIDIAKVNVHAWRQRISFVAQDPVLFPGTLRQNLDPLEQHSDTECAAVLSRVLGPEFSLEMEIDGGGRNLSQGQRQLVGLGRAVLRRSPVVILDEATASIDIVTARAIQEVLHDELRESTVITIAHRLEAVKYAEYCIVLDGGRVKISGPPSEVMNIR